MNLLEKHFPDKLKLPVIGNNDVMSHDQMPCTKEQAKVYFGDLFNAWFPDSNKV